MVQESWDLDAVSARYRGFIARWQGHGAGQGQGQGQGAGPAVRPGDPLAVQLVLASDWLRVIRADPRLPARHLPAGWPAAAAESLFVELDKAVERPAGEIARRILDLRPADPRES